MQKTAEMGRNQGRKSAQQCANTINAERYCQVYSSLTTHETDTTCLVSHMKLYF